MSEFSDLCEPKVLGYISFSSFCVPYMDKVDVPIEGFRLLSIFKKAEKGDSVIVLPTILCGRRIVVFSFLSLISSKMALAGII
jgi:hypothetical protein